MSNKVLILFTHPRFERSANNSKLVNSIPEIQEITFHDLYEKYPDFNIDIEHEKKLLVDHQVIIWQHPFYWYSSPPLLKQWIDLVLGFGWAYGPGGDALHGKIVFNSITSGGQRSYTATRQGQKFLQYDEDMVFQMADHRHDMKKYVLKARETFKLEEELLSKDLSQETGESDHSWDSEIIRETLGDMK